MESPHLTQNSQPLHGMFTAVPARYDIVNRVITLGLDRRWRRLAAKICLKDKPKNILDLGCGTGDLAINIAKLADKEIEIIGLDYSQPMLEKARRKAAKAGVENRIRFMHGEATAIPFPDEHFDCVGISFAFRNLTYKNPLGPKHLAEVKRVLTKGGRYVIVESSQPENHLIRLIFNFYLRIFVRPVGIVLSGNPGAYRYLAESVTRFSSASEIKDMLLEAGFQDVRYRLLFFGAACIHAATK